MDKIVAIPDLHGNRAWKEIVEKEEIVDKWVFVGDYCDSFTIPFVEQLHNLKEVIQFKKDNMEKVVLLLGNHDISYCGSTYNNGTSGFQEGVKGIQFRDLFDENADLFQMTYCPSEDSELLFSHAGVGKTWLEDNELSQKSIEIPWKCAEHVNEVWKYKPRQFLHNGSNGAGDDLWQTPVWIRPKSLMQDCETIKSSRTQIFGHTQVRWIELKEPKLRGKYLLIDALNTNNEYLVIKGNPGKYTFKSETI